MKKTKDNQRQGRMNRLLLVWFLVLTGSATVTPDITGKIVQEDEAAAHNAKGLELYKVGKYEEAVTFYKQAVKLKKEYAEAHFNLGDAYFQVREYKQAIDAYKRAVRYKPDLATAFNNMATAYYKLREYKKAVEGYNHAIQLDPKSSVTYFNLGMVHLESGDQKAAVKQYQTLKTIDARLADKLYALIYPPTATVLESNSMQRVRLNLTVTDVQGRPVNDLKPEELQVFEDGLAQTLSSFSKQQVPVIYGYAIDTSGSFADELQQAIDVVKALIRNNSVDDEAQIVRFIDTYKIETVQDFTANKEELDDGLGSLFIEGGQSAILDAVYLSAQSVAQYKASNGPYLRRAVILITDGDERSSYYNTEEVLTLLKKVDVQVFVVVLNKGSRSDHPSQRPRIRMPDVLKKLAEQTGGRVFFPKSNPELLAVPNEITKILRGEYLVEYKPLKPVVAGGAYRSVTVSIGDATGRAKRIVTTRAGYLIPEK